MEKYTFIKTNHDAIDHDGSIFEDDPDSETENAKGNQAQQKQ